MSSKKRKLSGLGGLELQMAYDALRKLRASFVVDEESESETDPNEPALEGFEEQVDTMLSMMGSRLQGPQSLSYSGMTPENLTKLKITYTGLLALKPDIQERITTTTSLGKDSLWSSDNLYRQLLWLEGLIPRSTEVSARVWIDAFFFRASAMLAAGKRMIVNLEHAVPSTTVSPSLSTLSGFIDYSAVVTSQRNAVLLLENPQLHVIKGLRPHSFFIVEAKLSNLSDHVPQAVAEMYASGKFLQTKFIRGALTNGRGWIFLHLKFTDDYEGASYLQSQKIKWTTNESLDGVKDIPRPWPDLIAAILEDWIEISYEDVGSDDWFERA